MRRSYVSPIVDKLREKYPKLLGKPKDAERVADAEKAANELSRNKALQAMLQTGFEKLESGQDKILAALAHQDHTMAQIGELVSKGFQKAGSDNDRLLQVLRDGLHSIQLQVAGISSEARAGEAVPADVAALSSREISMQGSTLQADAMRWVVAKQPSTATQRLKEARCLVQGGLRREPANADLLITLGFIEKTEAQAAQLTRDQRTYVSSLSAAGSCFGKVLEHDPRNVGALNGMANIFTFNGDYDQAINIGELAICINPNYGAAAWDLAIALDKKIKEVGKQAGPVKRLKEVYEHLLKIMPKQPEAFTAGDFAYVQGKLRELE
jgi:tetratricopeptide (TPR) repeat protein